MTKITPQLMQALFIVPLLYGVAQAGTHTSSSPSWTVANSSIGSNTSGSTAPPTVIATAPALAPTSDSTPDVSCNFVTGVATGTGAGTCVSVPPTCDGVTNTEASFKAFATWAISTWQAAHTGLIELYIPPGTNCSLTTYAVIFNGIKSLRVTGYGVTLSGAYYHLAGAGQQQDDKHSTRLLTAKAGATSVTVNPTSSSQPAACSTLSTCANLFQVGGWALIAGFDLQSGIGFPSNPAYFQYVHINAIDTSTGVISFDAPLADTYLSTWPNYNKGSIYAVPDDGGPATLYAFDPGWDTEVEWRGVTFATNNQLDAGGRSVIFRDVSFTASGISCVYPTQNRSIQIINATMTDCTMEYDKMVETATFTNVTIDQIAFQSRNKNVIVDSSTVRNFVGTPANLTITNSTITGQLLAGVTGYGRADTLTVANSSVASVGDPTYHVGYGVRYGGSANPIEGLNNIPGISSSGGVITITNSYIAGHDGSIGWAQPGTNVCWADDSNGCAGPIFQITDVTQDATNTYIATNAPGGGFPAWTIAGKLKIQNHPVPIVTFTNVTGSPDAVALSNAAAQGLPLYSYSKRTYVNADTGNAQPYFPIWGNLSKMTVTVNTAYSGALTGATMTPNTLFGNYFTASSQLTSYKPAIINLKSPGTRSLDATGGAPATWSGAQPGDILTNLSQALFASNSFRSVSGDLSSNPSHMSVTVEVITNQGLVIP
jgi:hypothetical protein